VFKKNLTVFCHNGFVFKRYNHVHDKYQQLLIRPLSDFLNRSGYDFKAILNHVSDHNVFNIDVQGRIIQQFFTMTINKLRFLDRLKHLPFTLEALANDLKKEGIHKFNITRDVFSHISTQNLEQYVLQKQKSPYSFMQDQSSFDYPRLPDIEHFTNDLNGEPCSPAECAHTQKVWDIFECQTRRDYSRNYMTLDVDLFYILLNYQTNMHTFFFLDP